MREQARCTLWPGYGLSILFLAVGCIAPGDVGKRSPGKPGATAIVNGQTDEADPEVVAIRSSTERCTGTLITPRVVLTAAHCIDSGPASSYSVFFGPDFTKTGTLIQADAVQKHPSYAAAPRHDLALIHLVTDALTSSAPLNTAAPSAGWTGSFVRAVGFGRTTSTAASDGLKRNTIQSISAYDEGSISITGPTPTCFGDSGGPAFLTVDGIELLAGVASISNCVDHSTDTRVDVDIDSFIQPFIDAHADDPGTDDCGDVTFLGVCDSAETLRYCNEGRLVQVDCSANGLVCGLLDDQSGNDCITAENHGPDTYCAGLGQWRGCNGDTLNTCSADGRHDEDDCTVYGQTCGGCESANGCGCVDRDIPQPDPGCDGDWSACNGDIVLECYASAYDEVDCSAFGMTCGGCDSADGCTCVPTVDPRCASLGAIGRCEDTTLQTCDASGTYYEEECYVCGRLDPTGAFACLPPAPDEGEPCGDLDERGGCYGNAYVYCNEGITVWQRCWEYGATCQPSGDSFECL